MGISICLISLVWMLTAWQGRSGDPISLKSNVCSNFEIENCFVLFVITQVFLMLLAGGLEMKFDSPENDRGFFLGIAVPLLPATVSLAFSAAVHGYLLQAQ